MSKESNLKNFNIRTCQNSTKVSLDFSGKVVGCMSLSDGLVHPT